MSDSVSSSIAVFLVFALVVLTLGAGTGVATADRGANDGTQCPSENPTRAYENVPQTAQESSVDGRTTALVAAGCIDAADVEPSGEVG